MKGPTNQLSQEEPDRLLFEYLEGTLSPAEEGAVEKRLLTDSMLQEDLENWKETYVAQDFYPTEALEKRILANTPKPFNFYRMSSAALLIAGLLISLFYFWPTNEAGEGSQMPVAKDRVIVGEQLKKTTENRNSKTAEPDKGRETPAPELPKKPTVAAAKPLNAENRQVFTPAFKEALPVVEKVLPKTGADEIALPEWILTIEKVKIPTPTSRTTYSISKKEQRKINRMKRKNQEKRMAREFMKGNRPYVVPLNTQNF